MNVSLPKLNTLSLRGLLQDRRVPSVPQVLTLSWWLLLGSLVFILALDGWLFYRYGLGTAPIPEEPDRAQTIRVREELMRSAAGVIRTRQEQYASSILPVDLPNPFR